MDITKEVPAIRQLREDIDDIVQRVKELDACEEALICRLKLTEAIMWLSIRLKRLNQPNPYPESMNLESMGIEPAADSLKM